MPVSFQSRLTVRSRTARRGPALFGAGLLLAGALVLVYIHIGYGWYAVSGFFWKHADGTVVNTLRTSNPTVQFSTGDGALHSFSEDYALLCGRPSDFCVIRHFNPGQSVPVVYDPIAPKRAFIHDWALFATLVTWLVELGIALLLAWIMAAMLSAKARGASVEFAPRRDPDAGSPLS